MKHGVKVNVVNFYTAEIGNPEPPAKLGRPMPMTVRFEPSSVEVNRQRASRPELQSPAVSATQSSGSRSRWVLIGGLATVIVLAGLTFAAIKFRPWNLVLGREGSGPSPILGGAGPLPSPPQSSKPPAPPAQPPGGAAPNLPIVSPPPGQPTGGGQLAIAPPSSPPKPTLPLAKVPPPTKGGPPHIPPKINKPPTVPGGQADGGNPQGEAPANPTPPQPKASPAALEEARERMIQLSARATAISRSMQRMEEQQAKLGGGMRTDMSAARDSMDYYLTEAQNSLAAQDLDGAKRKMNQAEANLEKLERFMGR